MASSEHSDNGSLSSNHQKPTTTISQSHSIRFWGIFTSLSILAFISALDVAIITTALPTIISSVGSPNLYIWIANSFVIASAVVQPLYGQLANIFGRRISLISSVVLFMLGSGIAGGATNAGMLIAGRTIQGVGAGGIYVLLDIVCCDLVPLRERGKYLGLMFSWSGLAAGLGPVVGGALAEHDWRWIFYLNLPICGVALIAILLFMRVNTGGEKVGAGWKEKLTSIDVLGNIIFIPSIFAVLYGLVSGGVEHPWSSWRIIVPLVLGGIGWIVFHLQQHFLAETPSMPSRLFSNRTSAVGFSLTFLSSITVQSASYFLPIYFQAVKGTTVLLSGVDFLPFAIGTLFSAVIAGALMSKSGAYRPLHAIAFALSALGFGLFHLLDEDSSKAEWAIFQLICSAGVGMVLSTMLPAIMAPLQESDVAAATATFSFIKTFGYVWGVTIPSVIFNGVFDNNISSITSTSLQEQLQNGAAYAFASEVHYLRDQLSVTDRQEMVHVYDLSLRSIWWFGLAISIFGLLLVPVEKHVELRTELETEYGISDRPEDVTASIEDGNPRHESEATEKSAGKAEAVQL